MGRYVYVAIQHRLHISLYEYIVIEYVETTSV